MADKEGVPADPLKKEPVKIPEFAHIQELITVHSNGEKVATRVAVDKDLAKLKRDSFRVVSSIARHVDKDVVALYTSEVLGTKSIENDREVIKPIAPGKTADYIYWLNGKYVEPVEVPDDYPGRKQMLEGLFTPTPGNKILRSRDGNFHCVNQKTNLILDVPVGIASV